MADKALSDLTATTELADTDLLFVETSAGPRKITAANATAELSAVTSVNGETGAVSLSAADVGADAAGSAATAQAAAIATAAADATSKANAAAAASQPLDADLTTIAAANNGAVLAATTASFTTADESKLDGIEAGADVTDAANVAAAGAVMGTLVDAKGDLLVGSTADTLARLPVGTNDYVLTADSAEATGVKWAAASGGGGAWSGNPWITPTISGARRGLWPLGFASHTTTGFGWQNTDGYRFWLPVERTLTSLIYEVTTASGTGGALATVGISSADNNGDSTAVIGWGQGPIDSTGVKTVSIGVTLTPGWYIVWFRCGQGGCTVRCATGPGPIPDYAGSATILNGHGEYSRGNHANDSTAVSATFFGQAGSVVGNADGQTPQFVALVLDEP